MPETEPTPTLLIVLGDGTTETTYYSDVPVRIVVAEPNSIAEDPDERVSEPIVFGLPDDDLPGWIRAKIDADPS